MKKDKNLRKKHRILIILNIKHLEYYYVVLSKILIIEVMVNILL